MTFVPARDPRSRKHSLLMCMCVLVGEGETGRVGDGRGAGEGRGSVRRDRGTLAVSEILKVFSEIKKSCVIIRF